MYLLIFGEFSIDDYGKAEFSLFFAATFFLALIMLNLIIALMTDTYERVMTNIVEQDFKQLNSIIMEYENFLYMNR